MSAGLPVLASDFPLWREIIDDAKCGLLVDPLNVKQIADAICYLLDNPEEAEEMGRNGYKAVHEKYNWISEIEKLNGFYGGLLQK
jgi:glycosyltransferase involved in cell wall biosynthesis